MPKKSSSPMSLFALQDIVTAVTGIMILLTLLLSLEIVQKAESFPAQTTDGYSQLLKQKQELENHLRSLQEQRRRRSGRPPKPQPPQSSSELQRKISMMEKRIDGYRRQLALLEQTLQSRQKDLEPKIDKKQKHLERQGEQLKQIQRKIQDLQGRIIYQIDGKFSQTPWLIQVAANRIMVAPMRKKTRPQVFSTPGMFLQWVDQHRDPQADYFLVVIKPKGVKIYRQLRDELHKRGFDMGIDLIPEDKDAISMQTGAGGP